MELLNYLLKVSACLTLCFAFYLIALSKLTFFKINRFYLLGSMVLSFIIPSLHFTFEREVAQVSVAQNPIAVHDADLAGQALQEETQTGINGGDIEITPFDWYSLLPYLYISIVTALLLLAFWKILKLLKYTRQHATHINGLKIVAKTKGFTNCSFFNYVFVDKEKLTETELGVLLRHEEVHARQYHSIDKIILIIAKAILWFNPIIYLYDKALEQNHEYEADELTSADFGTNHYASLLLRLAVEKRQVPLVHNFVKSPIKARIKMLFNAKSKNMKKLIYTLAIPIGTILIWGFTVDVIDVLPVQDPPNQFTLVLDAGHGGKNAGAKVNGISEKDITLAMAKKIKAMAEAKGMKVVLTRINDEYIDHVARAKNKGDILLSLHVNSAPSDLLNGVEMYTSGSYNDQDLKFAKSNSLTYYLYNSMRNVTGIKINNKPKKQNLVLLDRANIPGVLIELGFLTNKNDFLFITNEKKQDELAKLIVDGIGVYQQKSIPTAESMKLQESIKEFEGKYKAWKESAKYKSLVAETKRFKAQTLIGHIQSLNYFKRGATPDLDGFILKANNKWYRVYIDKEQLKSISFKVGDKVSLFAPKAEVWFDSEFPAIKPQKLTITPSIGVTPVKINPRLISSASLTVDAKTNIMYIKKGKVEIGNHFLEAEDMTWDKNNSTISAKKGTIRGTDGNVLSGENLIYNLNTNSYTINSASRNVDLIKSSLYQLLDRLPYHATDSVRVSKTLNTITLYGNASLNIDNKQLSGDKIEINKNSNVVSVYHGQIIGLDEEPIKADVISYNIVTKKGIINGPVYINKKN